RPPVQIQEVVGGEGDALPRFGEGRGIALRIDGPHGHQIDVVVAQPIDAEAALGPGDVAAASLGVEGGLRLPVAAVPVATRAAGPAGAARPADASALATEAADATGSAEAAVTAGATDARLTSGAARSRSAAAAAFALLEGVQLAEQLLVRGRSERHPTDLPGGDVVRTRRGCEGYEERAVAGLDPGDAGPVRRRGVDLDLDARGDVVGAVVVEGHADLPALDHVGRGAALVGDALEDGPAADPRHVPPRVRTFRLRRDVEGEAVRAVLARRCHGDRPARAGDVRRG